MHFSLPGAPVTSASRLPSVELAVLLLLLAPKPGQGQPNYQLSHEEMRRSSSKVLEVRCLFQIPLRGNVRRVDVVVKNVCLLVVLIGRLSRRGTGMVGGLNEVPAAAGQRIGPPAVQCEFQSPPDLLGEDGPARRMANVE